MNSGVVATLSMKKRSMGYLIFTKIKMTWPSLSLDTQLNKNFMWILKETMLLMKYKNWLLKSRTVRDSERVRIIVMSNFLKVNQLLVEIHFKNLISFLKSIKLILQKTFLKKLSSNSLKTFKFLNLNSKSNKSKCY